MIKKLYEGSIVNISLLVGELERENIFPIIKDRSESGILSGFAAEISMQKEVFVYEDQWEKAQKILEKTEIQHS